MDLSDFRASLEASAPPSSITSELRALWLDANGDWQAAHEIAQALPDPDGAWIHAYLHRKEGDVANAGYWYARAKKPVPKASLDTEWSVLAREFLARTRDQGGA